MKYHKLLLVMFFLIGAGASSAQTARSQQPLSLVAEAGRNIPASRGSNAQSFQIASAILKETRRILVVLPASYSQSAPDRRYPVTVVVDGEYLIAPVAAVSDELTRNGQIPESLIVGIENVENGRVIGETIHAKAPPEFRVMRWQYLKITPQGMTWGVMNGMRPRGVILFEGRLKGDTLAGNSRFGGIDFRLPDGSPPPAHHFSYTRLKQESDRSRKRDEWQRPAEVMDALAVKPGHRVADIGSGSGYFTFRLAARVGPEGKVYAVDIDEEAINKVRQRKEREKLAQVEPILGESEDPRLPNDLDAVLIVDTYHEFREYDRMMQAVFRALKPGGRLVIVDGEAPSGRPRTEYHRLHTIPAELVREEVARHGFVFKESRPGFYDAEYGKKMYFLIFERPLQNSSPKNQFDKDLPTRFR